ncbi:hypothetical protein H072_4284 [Dactylellina haptotyla CBS 200.50]|uniref:Uncharacterized protein n=1 Tax=Dactylellina haptotyla (strain CBS 200.50) TaxID=1284197 RepID=S8AFG1_DACHA|nr:hypothetical protein H072_4284 [Dactylellina haptotyla CBS 200.50]
MSQVISTILSPLALLLTSLPALIISEATLFYPGSALFKLIASAAFVWRSLSPAAALSPSSSAAFWITASLVCGWFGDLCLIPSYKSYYSPKGGHEGDSIWFKVGMLAFMLNHAGYIVAFLQCDDIQKINWQTFGAMFLTCIVLGDLAGMPVPWRKDFDASAVNAGSPRLPVVDSKVKVTEIPTESLAGSVRVDTPTYKSSKGKHHSRNNSSRADLSISIPPTPKGSNSNTPTASTPLLSPSQASSSSPFASMIPKIVIPADMKILIIIYQLIITTMVASAAGTRGVLSERLLGAFMFMVSDMMVAWDTFAVKERKDVDRSTSTAERKRPSRDGWKSRGIGWVLYFGGQYILAAYGAK